ncbi:ABC transporter substrate-binding protein [Dechloromonas sp. ARDL1]|uniref:ABC transporter substrate-binding protein n=1 Tax=Dechloromonas sp. ARDL1 TaxID=3322121 RepID=UPI003DA7A478
MKNQISRTAFGLAGAACLLLASPAQAQDVVRLGNLKLAHYGAVSYMKDYCGKYGLKVDERIFLKGTDMLPAIISGDLDLAAFGSEAAVSGRSNGVPIYALAGFSTGGARIIAGADSGIKSMKDLKGKKVAVTRGTALELMLYGELEKAGLTWSEKPGKDVQIVFLAFADLNNALLTKQIDAMNQAEPQATQALSKKIGIEITKPYNSPMGSPSRLLVMTEKMYKEKPDVAQRVISCFVDATVQFNKDMGLAEKYVREQLFKGQLTSQDFKDAMENAQYTYDVTLDHVDVITGYMAKYGAGKMGKPPKASEWVKLDLLQKAKADLKVK